VGSHGLKTVQVHGHDFRRVAGEQAVDGLPQFFGRRRGRQVVDAAVFFVRDAERVQKIAKHRRLGAHEPHL
jgi:hypothetical protein